GVGEQTGCTKNRSNIAPSLASESRCGVARFVFPLMPRSPHPWSSVRTTTTFGRSAAAAAGAARAAARNTPNRHMADSRKGASSADLRGRDLVVVEGPLPHEPHPQRADAVDDQLR